MSGTPDSVGETEAERRFRLMADGAPAMIWMADAAGARDWCNAGWLRFTGRPPAQEMGEGWIASVHPDDLAACREAIAAALAAQAAFSVSYRLRRHDGAWRWIADSGAPRHEGDGDFAGFIGSAFDIHEHREREAQLALLLRDKEVLLKEVHHRVKNNFQLVMSMISFRHRQADGAEGERLRELLERIGVLAGIQEQLVAQPHASSIDVGVQLRRLVDGLRSLHDGVPVTIEADIATLELPVDRAVTLGMIAAELLSNVYKHAFPEHRAGHVRVALAPQDGMAVLVVADDGVGAAIAPGGSGTVGMQIVQALAQQAAGEIAIASPPGLTVTVRLPLGG